MRKSVKIPVNSNIELINNLLSKSVEEEYFVLLCTNASSFKPHNFAFQSHDALAAVGVLQIVPFESSEKLSQLESSLTTNRDWHFGYIGYDLKNEIENLKSAHIDGLKFPEILFYVPRYVLEIKQTYALIHYHIGFDNENSTRRWYASVKGSGFNGIPVPELALVPRMAKSEYLERVRELQKHLFRGDIYEVNFCQEFYKEDIGIEPFMVFRKLLQKHPAPFSAYMKAGNHHILSSSPERFLKKEGSTIISQPMKGTAKRAADNELEASAIKLLQQDAKERAENTMIVDLVRNDLSRFCKKGSVKVEELCGVYPFPTVYQMISTVSGQVDSDDTFTKILKNSFPMGSMTGAPKVRAMELIEEYEISKRGVYSGTLGYIKPNGDFDFNVIIRTLLYNAATYYLSCSVGSAITAVCDPLREYEECLLKLEGLVNNIF